MIKVTLIALGKLKEKYLVEAVNEYKKRLSGYCNLEILEQIISDLLFPYFYGILIKKLERGEKYA
mgnify:CR=1 FL=1